MNSSFAPFKYKNLFGVALPFLVSLFMMSQTHVAHAGPLKWIFKEVVSGMAKDADIRRTTMNTGTSAIVDITLGATYQRNADELFGCGIRDRLIASGGVDNPSAVTSVKNYLTDPNGGRMDPSYADESISEAQSLDPGVCDLSNVGGPTARNSGSLLALASTLEGAIDSEVVPVNLAVYFKDIARRTPILKDTAYAASYGNLIGEDVVLDLWKVLRNVSYGVVAISMIIVGIMIMMRKKINPQTSITVQNALPRLVMSIVLITFSYPIGAMIASMVVPAVSMSNGFFSAAAASSGASYDPAANTILFIEMFTLILLFLPGFSGVAIGVFIVVAGLVMYVVALVKVMISYLRIMFNTVTAPLVFAAGAIPGKENVTGDWFKNMGVEVASIAATFFMMKLSFFVGSRMLESAYGVTPDDPITNSLMSDGSLFSRAVVLSLVPLVVLVCLGASLKMRDSVKGWILGDSAKKRR